MFDFAWSEMAVIAVVALVAIGPKDMPVAIRALTNTIKKARRMASEFQTHVDEMVREANLDEVRQQLNEIRNFDVAAAVEKHVDPDRTLRDSFSDPFQTTPVSSTGPEQVTAGTAAQAEIAELDRPKEAPPEQEQRPPPGVPAFIPPRLAIKAQQTAEQAEAPAFIPPSAAQPNRISP